jgi:hypothetical protein
LGIALAFMALISISHQHKEIETLRLKKRWRLCGRFAVSVLRQSHALDIDKR